MPPIYAFMNAFLELILKKLYTVAINMARVPHHPFYKQQSIDRERKGFVGIPSKDSKKEL